MYVLVRSDLSLAQQAVQAIHAAIETARSGLIPADIEHPHLVLLTVPDERGLELFARRLRTHGVPHRGFEEPDVGFTALATAPLGIEGRRLFRKFRLLDGPKSARPAEVVL